MKIKLLGVMILSACIFNAYAGNDSQAVKQHKLDGKTHSDHQHHKAHHKQHHDKHHHQKKHHHGDHKHQHHSMMNATLQKVALADTSHAMKNKENRSAVKKEASGKIMQVLVVANKGEIAAAKEALKKSSNKAVRSYAEMMVNQHSDNLEKTRMIMKKFNIKPVNSPISTKLQTHGKEALKTLQSLDGTAFDKKYMSDMVQDHKKVLMILTNLDKEAKNPSIKDHLDATIEHVKMHLKKAEDIKV